MVRDDIAKGLIRFTDPERQTVIMSTHELKEVEPLLDEIIVLKGGQLIAHEAVDEIRDMYGKDATSWMVSLFSRGKGVGKMKPVVELKNLSKTIGKKKIIDNLNLSLYPGTNYRISRSEWGRENDNDSNDGRANGTVEGEVVIEGISLRDDFEEVFQKSGLLLKIRKCISSCQAIKTYCISRACIKA